MRVIFSHPYPVARNEGLDRAVLGLARGLKNRGVEVEFLILEAPRKVLAEFQQFGKTHVAAVRDGPLPPGKSGRRTASDILFGDTSRKLYKMIQRVRSEYSILIAAQEVGFKALLKACEERLFGAVGWWCFGTPHLYPFTYPLRDGIASSSRFGLDVLALLTPSLRREFWRLKDLDFVITGAKWLSDVLNYFGGIEPAGFLYPPTDTTRFSPNETAKSNSKYVFSLGDAKDVQLDILESVSRKVPLVRAGRPLISAARNLPDAKDLDLIDLYSSAFFTAYPTKLEQFGLPVAESLSCGTPVLTLPWQGPGEIIMDGVTGWKATDRPHFVQLATKIYQNGYDQDMRRNCREFAERYLSIDACAENFMTFAERLGI